MEYLNIHMGKNFDRRLCKGTCKLYVTYEITITYLVFMVIYTIWFLFFRNNQVPKQQQQSMSRNNLNHPEGFFAAHCCRILIFRILCASISLRQNVLGSSVLLAYINKTSCI